MNSNDKQGLKQVFILVAVLLVLTILGTIVFAKYLNNSKSRQLEQEIQQTAQDMHKVDPSKSVEEWEEIAGAPLTDAQKDIANVVVGDIPTVTEFIEDEDPDDNTVTFLDENGDEWQVELDDEILNMTDEEIAARMAELNAELDAALENYEQFEGETIVSGLEVPEDYDYEPDENSYDEGREYVEAEVVIPGSSTDSWGDINPREGLTEEEIQKILDDSQNTEYRIHGT